MILLKCACLLLLDIPYYIFKALEETFWWAADMWPPFTEMAKDIWRKR